MSTSSRRTSLVNQVLMGLSASITLLAIAPLLLLVNDGDEFMTKLAIAALTAGLSIGGFVASLILRSIKPSLAELSQVAEAISTGDLSVRSSLRRNDEIGEFATIFNRMASQLQARDIQAGLHSLDEVLVNTSDLQKLVSNSLEKICQLTNSQMGCMYLCPEGTSKLVLSAEWGCRVGQSAVEIAFGDGLVGHAAQLGQAIIWEGDRLSGQSLTYRTPVGDLQPQSLAAFPLMLKRQVVGVLFLASLLPFSAQSRNLLQSIDRRLATAISNAQSVQTIARQREELTTVFEQLADGVLLSDPAGRVLKINSAGRKMLGVIPPDQLDNTSPVVPTTMEKIIEQFAMRRPDGRPVGLSELVIFRAMAEGRVVEDQIVLHRPEGREVILSTKAAPLVGMESELIGSVMILRDVTEERYRDQVMQETNRIMAEQQKRMSILQRLTNLINQQLQDLNVLLSSVVEATCDAIAWAELGILALYNPKTAKLTFSATKGLDPDFPQQLSFGLDATNLFTQVFRTGIPAEMRQGEGIFVEGIKVQSALAVPIESSRSGRLGVLAIANSRLSNAPSREDINLLGSFGVQAAIAIGNAQLINQIEAQNAQLLEATQLKSQFLTNISHELRTPMNAIIGFSQVLLRQRRDPLTPNQADMVERILRNGRTLLELINDILDLAKIESGRMDLHPETFHLDELIHHTCESLQPLASAKSLEFSFQNHLGRVTAYHDPLRLRQILTNLIGNAIKFTDQGEVRVELTADDSPDHFRIAVHDTGIGIAQEHQKTIFEQFRQIDQSTTRRHSGTGLGLAITQQLVMMMQGKIFLESELGKGSTFYVSLPLRGNYPDSTA
jgi:signal transduction histidine kinase/PAS domain-containing protein/HAMP domain-containing protein